jgi:hypothetical protein
LDRDLLEKAIEGSSLAVVSRVLKEQPGLLEVRGGFQENSAYGHAINELFLGTPGADITARYLLGLKADPNPRSAAFGGESVLLSMARIYVATGSKQALGVVSFMTKHGATLSEKDRSVLETFRVSQQVRLKEVLDMLAARDAGRGGNPDSTAKGTGAQQAK